MFSALFIAAWCCLASLVREPAPDMRQCAQGQCLGLWRRPDLRDRVAAGSAVIPGQCACAMRPRGHVVMGSRVVLSELCVVSLFALFPDKSWANVRSMRGRIGA
jgi:hypothetical protein